MSECVSGTDDIENELAYKELVEAINGFLAALPQQKRDVFIRRYWYSDSVSSIAKAYDMKENAVSMMLGRLRLKLHEYLTERGFEI